MATATKTSLKKWSRAASKFIALILSRSIRQMLTIFSGVEFRDVHLPWLGLYNILIFSLHFLFIVLECRKSVFQCWFGMLCILQGKEITSVIINPSSVITVSTKNADHDHIILLVNSCTSLVFRMDDYITVEQARTSPPTRPTFFVTRPCNEDCVTSQKNVCVGS